MTLTWSINKDFKQLFGYLKEGIVLNSKMSKKRLITELVVSKILFYGYILVIPLIFLPIAWWAVVLLYLMMHFISGFTLSVIFQTAHVMPESEYPMPDDSGNIDNNWAIHQLMTTNNYAPGNRILSWFVGGLNYQVEHHLFPTICHVHYRKISGIVQETAKEYNIPYHVHPTFINALSAHYQMLKKLGTQDLATKNQ
jgi:linoleoyl-CoA desaturase